MCFFDPSPCGSKTKKSKHKHKPQKKSSSSYDSYYDDDDGDKSAHYRRTGAGGKLQVKIRKLRVRGLIQDLPDDIEVNIDALEIGKSVRVRELSVPNVELLDTPENSVVSVVVTRAARSAADAAGDEAEGETEEGTEEVAE